MAGPFIALLTDFGHDDPFVGIMKAVMFSRCPDATIIDLTHGIPPQGVDVGAFWLERSADWLPRGAVVVAVVDPGVGTERGAVVALAGGRTFVGPDNGLLTPVVARDPAAVAYRIDVTRLGLPTPSRTFHGRDVFAPVAAELAAGRWSAAEVGTLAGALSAPPFSRATTNGDAAEGVVTAVDRFGNLITNIDRALVPAGPVVAEIAGTRAAVHATYGEVRSGELLGLVNAFDVVEIAERDGSAARSLGVGRGTKVVLRPDPGRGSAR
jgi:S-adenosylmethionine hydrolase